MVKCQKCGIEINMPAYINGFTVCQECFVELREGFRAYKGRKGDYRHYKYRARLEINM